VEEAKDTGHRNRNLQSINGQLQDAPKEQFQRIEAQVDKDRRLTANRNAQGRSRRFSDDEEFYSSRK
jgi:hypothetical protein